MQTLAPSDSNRDAIIAKELESAGIRAIPSTMWGKEAYIVHGPDKVFLFFREEEAWLVEGEVPIDVAEGMYREPEKEQMVINDDLTCFNPTSCASMIEDRLYVTRYRITSQEALNLFAKTMKDYELFIPPCYH